MAGMGLIWLLLNVFVYLKYARPLVDVWRDNQFVYFEADGVKRRIPFGQITSVERLELFTQIVVKFSNDGQDKTVMFMPAVRFRFSFILPKEIVFGVPNSTGVAVVE